MRARNDSVFRPTRGEKTAAICLLDGPGSGCVGEDKAFKHAPMGSTLVALWAKGYMEPSLVLTDLHSQGCRTFEGEMRFWIERGFRTFKLMGADWGRTRRTDLMRASRQMLVLAAAFIDAAATGIRQEDAKLAGISPEERIAPLPICHAKPVRKVNLRFP